jgi:FkbM family methyltransferase
MHGIKALTRRVPKFLRPHWRRSYSQEGEDLVMNIFFGWDTPGIYVDIGAHDPLAWSNTKKLSEIGWWGLNIDPLPGMAKKFRRHRPRDICIEAAIDIGADQPLRYWMFEGEERWNCLAPSEPYNERGGRIFRPTGSCVVPVISISEALHRANLPQIDLLNLDIEGGEDHVLSTWPWDRYVPRAICVEIIGKPAAAVAHCALTCNLAARGLVFASQLVSSVIYLREDLAATAYPKAHVSDTDVPATLLAAPVSVS